MALALLEKRASAPSKSLFALAQHKAFTHAEQAGEASSPPVQRKCFHLPRASQQVATCKHPHPLLQEHHSGFFSKICWKKKTASCKKSHSSKIKMFEIWAFIVIETEMQLCWEKWSPAMETCCIRNSFMCATLGHSRNAKTRTVCAKNTHSVSVFNTV